VQAVIFGDDFECDILATCQRHYKYLQRRDGITLGYCRINGVVRAYVKEEGF
jgi:hypothetical protein